MPGIGDDKELQKRLMKEAIKDWLDEQVMAFGWWSLKAIVGLGLGILLYMSLKLNGWTKLP